MTAADLTRAAEILGIHARTLRDSYTMPPESGSTRRRWHEDDAAYKREHDDAVHMARGLRRLAKEAR